MGALEFTGVTKEYTGGVLAVRDFTLSVADGEFIVLVGPSGCGKSTLLRMIAGLESISGGELRLDDRVINRLPPKDRDISLVFQDYALYGHMTVYDNVGMSMKVRHTDPARIYDVVTETSADMGIFEFLNRYPGQLSGGQKQRVALSRAITRQPKVFLMDEPLSNLDAKMRVHTRTEIVRLQRRLKVTTVYVTHDQVEAMTMADRVVVMRDGIVQQIGTPQEVYDTPNNMFVGGFIGSLPMNFLQGVFASGRFTVGGCSLAVPESKLPSLAPYEGRALVLGIRPEHIVIAREGDAEAIALTIDGRENLGSYYHFFLLLDALPVVVRAERGKDADQAISAAQARLHVRFDLARAHFYDPETTERVR